MDRTRNKLLYKNQSQKTPLKEAKPDNFDYQISIDNQQKDFLCARTETKETRKVADL